MPTVQKHIGFLEFSSGTWYEGIDITTLSQADQDLFYENGPVKTFYPEDVSPSGPPLNYTDVNKVENWAKYAEKYCKEDHLGVKLALIDILQAATGATEQLKFDTFNEFEQEYLLAFNTVNDGAIGVGFYLNEEGFDVAIATDFYSSVVLKSQQSVSDACELRYQNKAVGWYPIMFSFYSTAEAFLIDAEIDDPTVNFKKHYTEFGTFGTLWGDVLAGMLDYFNGSGSVDPKLSDHTLLEGKLYADARDALTEYFYQRWNT